MANGNGLNLEDIFLEAAPEPIKRAVKSAETGVKAAQKSDTLIQDALQTAKLGHKVFEVTQKKVLNKAAEDFLGADTEEEKEVKEEFGENSTEYLEKKYNTIVPEEERQKLDQLKTPLGDEVEVQNKIAIEDLQKKYNKLFTAYNRISRWPIPEWAKVEYQEVTQKMLEIIERLKNNEEVQTGTVVNSYSRLLNKLNDSYARQRITQGLDDLSIKPEADNVGALIDVTGGAMDVLGNNIIGATKDNAEYFFGKTGKDIVESALLYGDRKKQYQENIANGGYSGVGLYEATKGIPVVGAVIGSTIDPVAGKSEQFFDYVNAEKRIFTDNPIDTAYGIAAIFGPNKAGKIKGAGQTTNAIYGGLSTTAKDLVAGSVFNSALGVDSEGLDIGVSGALGAITTSGLLKNVKEGAIEIDEALEQFKDLNAVTSGIDEFFQAQIGKTVNELTADDLKGIANSDIVEELGEKLIVNFNTAFDNTMALTLEEGATNTFKKAALLEASTHIEDLIKTGKELGYDKTTLSKIANVDKQVAQAIEGLNFGGAKEIELADKVIGTMKQLVKINTERAITEFNETGRVNDKILEAYFDKITDPVRLTATAAADVALTTLKTEEPGSPAYKAAVDYIKKLSFQEEAIKAGNTITQKQLDTATGKRLENLKEELTKGTKVLRSEIDEIEATLGVGARGIEKNLPVADKLKIKEYEQRKKFQDKLTKGETTKESDFSRVKVTNKDIDKRAREVILNNVNYGSGDALIQDGLWENVLKAERKLKALEGITRAIKGGVKNLDAAAKQKLDRSIRNNLGEETKIAAKINYGAVYDLLTKGAKGDTSLLEKQKIEFQNRKTAFEQTFPDYDATRQVRQTKDETTGITKEEEKQAAIEKVLESVNIQDYVSEYGIKIDKSYEDVLKADLEAINPRVYEDNNAAFTQAVDKALDNVEGQLRDNIIERLNDTPTRMYKIHENDFKELDDIFNAYTKAFTEPQDKIMGKSFVDWAWKPFVKSSEFLQANPLFRSVAKHTLGVRKFITGVANPDVINTFDDIVATDSTKLLDESFISQFRGLEQYGADVEDAIQTYLVLLNNDPNLNTFAHFQSIVFNRIEDVIMDSKLIIPPKYFEGDFAKKGTTKVERQTAYFKDVFGERLGVRLWEDLTGRNLRQPGGNEKLLRWFNGVNSRLMNSKLNIKAWLLKFEGEITSHFVLNGLKNFTKPNFDGAFDLYNAAKKDPQVKAFLQSVGISVDAPKSEFAELVEILNSTYNEYGKKISKVALPERITEKVANTVYGFTSKANEDLAKNINAWIKQNPQERTENRVAEAFATMRLAEELRMRGIKVQDILRFGETPLTRKLVIDELRDITAENYNNVIRMFSVGTESTLTKSGVQRLWWGPILRGFFFGKLGDNITQMRRIFIEPYKKATRTDGSFDLDIFQDLTLRALQSPEFLAQLVAFLDVYRTGDRLSRTDELDFNGWDAVKSYYVPILGITGVVGNTIPNRWDVYNSDPIENTASYMVMSALGLAQEWMAPSISQLGFGAYNAATRAGKTEDIVTALEGEPGNEVNNYLNFLFRAIIVSAFAPAMTNPNPCEAVTKEGITTQKISGNAVSCFLGGVAKNRKLVNNMSEYDLETNAYFARAIDEKLTEGDYSTMFGLWLGELSTSQGTLPAGRLQKAIADFRGSEEYARIEEGDLNIFKEGIDASEKFIGNEEEAYAAMVNHLWNSAVQSGKVRPEEDVAMRMGNLLEITDQYILEASDEFNRFDKLNLTSKEKSAITKKRFESLKKDIQGKIGSDTVGLRIYLNELFKNKKDSEMNVRGRQITGKEQAFIKEAIMTVFWEELKDTNKAFLPGVETKYVMLQRGKDPDKLSSQSTLDKLLEYDLFIKQMATDKNISPILPTAGVFSQKVKPQDAKTERFGELLQGWAKLGDMGSLSDRQIDAIGLKTLAGNFEQYDKIIQTEAGKKFLEDNVEDIAAFTEWMYQKGGQYDEFLTSGKGGGGKISKPKLLSLQGAAKRVREEIRDKYPEIKLEDFFISNVRRANIKSTRQELARRYVPKLKRVEDEEFMLSYTPSPSQASKDLTTTQGKAIKSKRPKNPKK